MRLFYLGGLLPKDSSKQHVVLLSRNAPIVIENRVGYAFDVPTPVANDLMRRYNIDSTIFTTDERMLRLNQEPVSAPRYTREELEAMLAQLDEEETSVTSRSKRSKKQAAEALEPVQPEEEVTEQ